MRTQIIISAILFSVQAFAQTGKGYDSLIKLSENLAYDFQFDSCETVLAKAVKVDSVRPEAYLLKSKLHLWYFLGSNDHNEYENFIRYSDSVIAKTDYLLYEDEYNPNLLYYLGNIYKYRAMAYGSSGSTLDAFWSTKKAVSYYENVVEIDSSYYAAYGGIGIFEYALSYVPALFNWALAISGLTADQSNGFRFIELAAENASIDNIEYQFHLAKLYDEHLAEYEKSLSILRQLLKKYPNNLLFHYQAAIEYIKVKNLEEAIEELIIVKEIGSPRFIQTLSFSSFLLGDVYFRMNQFEKAVKHYKEFLMSTTTIDYTGIASLRAAYCNYFLKNESEFKRYLFLSSNGNMDLEEDHSARQQGLKILENGIDPELEKLLLLENLYLSDNIDAAEEIIEELGDSLRNSDISAQVAYYKSSILISKQKIEAAKDVLPQIDSLDLESALWVVPMTYFNLAKISYIENNYISANHYLDLAESNNDHRRQKVIQSYINGLRKKVKIN